MKKFKLFDTREKFFMTNDSGVDIEFDSYEDADEYRHEYLRAGNYPDYPTTVIQICETK